MNIPNEHEPKTTEVTFERIILSPILTVPHFFENKNPITLDTKKLRVHDIAHAIRDKLRHAFAYEYPDLAKKIEVELGTKSKNSKLGLQLVIRNAPDIPEERYANVLATMGIIPAPDFLLNQPGIAADSDDTIY